MLAQPFVVPLARSRAVVAAALALTLWLLPGCRTAEQAPSVGRPEELRQEIEALEFLNSLQLEPKQPAALVEALKSTATEIEGRREGRRKLSTQLVPLLQQKRDALLKGQQPTPELEAQIKSVESQIQEQESLPPETVKAVAGKLKVVLTKAQVAVATGELDSRIQATEMLDGYRAFPEDAFKAEIRPFAVEMATRGTNMTADQVEAIFTEARGLPEDQYKQDKEKYVRQLIPLFAAGGEAQEQLLVEAFSRPQLVRLLAQKSQPGRGK
jgi:hypothetical protein